MRFGLLTQWYDPEPGPAALPGALARGLRDAGHDVSVLTGFPNYPSGSLHPDYTQERGYVSEEEGIRVFRAPLYISHDASALRRIANYFSFGISASLVAREFFRDLDAVWVNYSPITVSLPLWVGQSRFRTPAVVEVGDLWPDTVFTSDMLEDGKASRVARLVLDKWCDLFYRSAESVIYISPGVHTALLGRGVAEEKLAYVPKWSDEAVFLKRGNRENARADLDIDAEAKVLLYAGALGAAQGLTSLVGACEFVEDPNFVLVIAGSGTAEADLRKLAKGSTRKNVKFIGRVPQYEMPNLMAAADYCYVGLAPDPLSSITMPSKTQAILASGKPILVAASGDVANFVESREVGRSADPSSSASISEAIEWFCSLSGRELASMGVRAEETYSKEFSLARGVKSIENLLVDAASKRGREA